MSVVLITGSGSGFGMLAALEFARRGDDVYATMRNPDTKAKNLLDLAAAEGLTVHPIEIDVMSDSSVERGVSEILARAGQIDVVVNNAGLGHSGPAETAAEEDTRRLFETVFWGAVRMVRATAPGMRDRQSGHFINVSSMLGRVPGILLAGYYCAVKHALSAWSEALAIELSTFHVDVTLIEPGVFATPMADQMRAGPGPVPGTPYEELERLQLRAMQGSDHLGEPSVVARAIADAAYANPRPPWVLIGDDAVSIVEAYRTMSADQYTAMMAAVVDQSAS